MSSGESIVRHVFRRFRLDSFFPVGYIDSRKKAARGQETEDTTNRDTTNQELLNQENMTQTEKRIIEEVEAGRADFVQFFRKLVMTKSFTKQEQEVAQLPIRGRVVFTGVCDGLVCGDQGILYLLKEGVIRKEHPEDFGINCEPTHLEEMNMATKGVMRADVTVIGGCIRGKRWKTA